VRWFARPRELEHPPARLGQDDAARFLALARSLTRKGLLLPVAARGKRLAPRTSCMEMIVDASLMAHAVAGVGSDLHALASTDGGALSASSVGTRLMLARHLLDSVAATLATLREQRVSANRRAVAAGRFKGALRVNLGAGNEPIPGWINLDVGVGQLRQCLQWGLPFPDRSVRHVYFAHVLEHLSFRDQALSVLREIRRVLAPRGVARIVVPDIGKLIQAYARDDRDLFAARKRIWKPGPEFQTPLEQLLSYSGASKPAHEFFGHKWGYDYESLERLLRDAGFIHVARSGPAQSTIAELRPDSASWAASRRHRGESFSLFVEAQA
jgi:predicted SAM-dependent methyltransferase